MVMDNRIVHHHKYNRTGEEKLLMILLCSYDAIRPSRPVRLSH